MSGRRSGGGATAPARARCAPILADGELRLDPRPLRA